MNILFTIVGALGVVWCLENPQSLPGYTLGETTIPLVFEIAFYTMSFNAFLAVFNLLPIPPLDGYNAALGLLPARQALTLQRYAQYGMMILLALVLASYVLPGGGPLSWLFRVAQFIARVLLGSA